MKNNLISGLHFAIKGNEIIRGNIINFKGKMY